MPHAHDTDLWIVRDPADWQGASITYTSEQRAFEEWRPGDVALWCNPVEGFCRDMTGDFEDRREDEDTEASQLAASLARHERSMSDPARFI